MGNDLVAAFYEDYSIYWYGITMAAALLAGVITSMFLRAFQHERINDVLFVAVPALPLGLMGARAFYCWHGAGRQVDISQLTRIDTYLEGGFGLYGALGVGVLVMALVCLLLNINILRLSDACVPGLALGICIGRLASQFSATDRGGAVSAKWLQRVPFATWDPSGEEWLLNVYFFEALAAFLIFVLLTAMFLARYHFYKFPCRRGDITLMFMFLYGLSQCFFESIRSDALYWNSTLSSRLHFVMISMAISAVVAAIALSVLILRFAYWRGIGIYTVFTVVLSAFGFSMIFSQEIRLPFKEERFIFVMIAQGALVLIIMGLWLVYRQTKDRHAKPALPWLNPRYWYEKIKGLSFFDAREKRNAS